MDSAALSSAPTRPRSRHHSSLSSVASAARLLKEFAGDRQEMGVTEAARRLGIGKSTAHRLLNTLTEERLLEQDPRTGAYRLGLAMYVLGRSVSTYSIVHEVSAPVLDQLRAATKAAVQVSVLDGREVVYVERRETPATLRLFTRIGHRFPANVTSSGKLLLAYLPQDRLEDILDGWELPARTEHSVVEMAVLRSQLDVIRSRGWAVNVDETEDGLTSIAAPIRNADGTVVASVSVVFPTDGLDEEGRSRFMRPCLDAAAAISRRLGYRSPNEDRENT